MTTDDTRPLGLRLPRSNWPETYTAQEAKAWIAAMDAAEALLYDEGIVDEFGYTSTLDAERTRHAALVAAAREVLDRGHFPGCAMHAGPDRMMDERRCDCGSAALRAALAATPAPAPSGAEAFDAAVQRAFAGTGVTVNTTFTPDDDWKFQTDLAYARGFKAGHDAALDVERLARALGDAWAALPDGTAMADGFDAMAAHIARAYEADR